MSLSLAEKCRILFGAAVVFSLVLALLIPYYWMGKLADKTALDAGQALADVVYTRHFNMSPGQVQLPKLDSRGYKRENSRDVVAWYPLKDDNAFIPDLDSKTQEALANLREDKRREDYAWTDTSKKLVTHHYIKIVRAQDSCITCHNPQGSASPFNKNQLIGAIVVETPARERAKTLYMNLVWTVVAGLLAGTGAMVAFYLIVQRIILRPIRQLRALVNNIAEGNLEARSAIKTGDEYERLSDAFNDMLDGLRESQEKLRQANKQLDGKIAQLSERNIELFKANKLKSEFLANMSHEFRTPLNAILGFAELLRERPADNVEKSKRYAENIVTSGRNLLNMINDLLDLAKAEAGKMQVRIENADIRKLCQGLVAFFAPLSDEKMLHVRLSVEENLPVIKTDPGKVQQILYNLLSNAIKFTPENGTIQVTAKRIDDKTVRIAVSDTGPGISQEYQEHIFEKFRQIDGSITRKGTGTGLGLAICKELTNLIAGNISLESELGQGSTFYLDIPTELQIKETQPDPYESLSSSGR